MGIGLKHIIIRPYFFRGGQSCYRVLVGNLTIVFGESHMMARYKQCLTEFGRAGLWSRWFHIRSNNMSYKKWSRE